MTDGATPPALGHLPLQEWGFYNCPAIPFWALPDGSPDMNRAEATVKQLVARGQGPAVMAAYGGLKAPYSIGGNTNLTAFEYLYGSKFPQPPDPTSPLCRLPLGQASQFTLPWTKDRNVYDDSFYLRGPFADTLKQKDAATRAFWPTIANFGIPYNLLLLSKITTQRAVELEAEFGAVWAAEGMGAAVQAGLAYEIDTRIIEVVEPYAPIINGVRLAPRFAPGCITLLKQDPKTKELKPVAVKLYTAGASNKSRVYGKGSDAWIYALQAAKTSITVWGIWLGHVFHWHIPTAAMQMTMRNELPANHPLWTFLAPQSEFLIDFDFVLLQVPGFFEKISPPTPVAGPMRLLDLLDRYAAGKTFFDLDPLSELKNQGIDVSNFTRDPDRPWDVYPVAGYLTTIWSFCERFVKVVVNELYKDDKAVAQDTGLQAWIHASQDPANGNVKLPDITTKALLIQLLTSLLYRVTAHAAGSLISVVNPALAFISNFPPCLQQTDLPEPTKTLTEAELLARMPYTGTMGAMTTFYFTFADTPPNTPAIPKGGVNLGLYWTDPTKPWTNMCNAALVKYRSDIVSFVEWYTNNWNAELDRVGNVPPGPVPAYAAPGPQVEQWPRSIEI
jgi:hypothetical protein